MEGGWGAGGAAGGGCYAPGGAALGEARARAGARVHGARLTGPGLRCPPSPPAGTFQFLSLAPLGEARGQRLRTFFMWATGVPGLGDRGGGEGDGALCGATRGWGGAGGGGAGQNERRSRTHYTPQDRLYTLKKKIHAAEGTTEERAEFFPETAPKPYFPPSIPRFQAQKLRGSTKTDRRLGWQNWMIQKHCQRTRHGPPRATGHGKCPFCDRPMICRDS